jgi:hypothetical protein
MKVKLANVRLSFPDLFKAVQYQGEGPFNYRAQFLVEPGSANHKAIEAAIKEVAKAKWAAKADAILKSIAGNSQKYCYIDGDTKEYDGYAGMMALSTTRQQEKGRPLIIDQQKNPLTEADGKPYAGCYVNASVEFWAQDNSFGKAIRCTLLGVQFAKDGDAFGGGAAPSADDFDSIEAGADAEDFV